LSTNPAAPSATIADLQNAGKVIKMKFIVRKYFSGYCSYEIEAENKDEAYEKSLHSPIKENELLSTLEEWRECDQVEPDTND